MSPGRSRSRVVVLESDDWGLCAWSPDEPGWRALAGLAPFRGAAGRVYGRSTLETAADVRALRAVLLGAPGADGRPAVLQANTIVAAPDYERIAREGLPAGPIPLVALPELPSRWARPGLREEVDAAIAEGVWRPELHGLHHLPEAAWLAALGRGDADARAALAVQSPACAAVQDGAEYGPAEPAAARTARLERAVVCFRRRFGRAPESFCPPDYAWDAGVEREAARLGVRALQGDGERGRWARLRRRLPSRWPRRRNGLLLMPPRIAFEPRGDASAGSRLGPERAHRAALSAWARGRPAVIGTHRVNYAHLDPDWSEAGRRALADLLARLRADGAVFRTDAEVRASLAAGEGGR